ncbi:hypothetical protein [Mycoplasma sp. 2634B]|uniref:hypothetical protein n=1 Tax=Mycoplasma sp. 2634B TaxID=3401692 RepID=UPI003AAC4577
MNKKKLLLSSGIGVVLACSAPAALLSASTTAEQQKTELNQLLDKYKFDKETGGLREDQIKAFKTKIDLPSANFEELKKEITDQYNLMSTYFKVFINLTVGNPYLIDDSTFSDYNFYGKKNGKWNDMKKAATEAVKIFESKSTDEVNETILKTKYNEFQSKIVKILQEKSDTKNGKEAFKGWYYEFFKEFYKTDYNFKDMELDATFNPLEPISEKNKPKDTLGSFGRLLLMMIGTLDGYEKIDGPENFGRVANYDSETTLDKAYGAWPGLSKDAQDQNKDTVYLSWIRYRMSKFREFRKEFNEYFDSPATYKNSDNYSTLNSNQKTIIDEAGKYFASREKLEKIKEYITTIPKTDHALLNPEFIFSKNGDSTDLGKTGLYNEGHLINLSVNRGYWKEFDKVKDVLKSTLGGEITRAHSDIQTLKNISLIIKNDAEAKLYEAKSSKKIKEIVEKCKEADAVYEKALKQIKEFYSFKNDPSYSTLSDKAKEKYIAEVMKYKNEYSITPNEKNDWSKEKIYGKNVDIKTIATDTKLEENKKAMEQFQKDLFKNDIEEKIKFAFEAGKINEEQRDKLKKLVTDSQNDLDKLKKISSSIDSITDMAQTIKYARDTIKSMDFIPETGGVTDFNKADYISKLTEGENLINNISPENFEDSVNQIKDKNQKLKELGIEYNKAARKEFDSLTRNLISKETSPLYNKQNLNDVESTLHFTKNRKDLESAVDAYKKLAEKTQQLVETKENIDQLKDLLPIEKFNEIKDIANKNDPMNFNTKDIYSDVKKVNDAIKGLEALGLEEKIVEAAKAKIEEYKKAGLLSPETFVNDLNNKENQNIENIVKILEDAKSQLDAKLAEDKEKAKKALEEAKDKADKAIQSEIKKYDDNTVKLSETKKAEILKLLKEEQAKIKNATTPEAAAKIADDAIKLAKAKADDYANKLAEAKKTAKEKLDAKEKELETNKGKYTDTEYKELEKILTDAKQKVEEQTDIDQIQPIVDKALTDLDAKAKEITDKKTADAKDKANKDLEAEIQKYEANADNLPSDKKAEIINFLKEKKTAINNLTDETEIKKASDEAKKAAKDLADKYAQDLAEAKKTAKEKLDAKEKELETNKSKYTDEEYKELQKILTNGKSDIDKQTDIDQIQPIVNKALTDLEAKAKEITDKKTADAKDKANKELDEEIKKYQDNTDNLPSDKKDEIINFLKEKKTAIDKLTDESAIKNASDQAKTDAKAKADEYKKEIAEAKKTAEAKLNEKEKELEKDKSKYTEEQVTQLKKILSDAKDAIKGKTKSEEIKSAVEEAIKEFDQKAGELALTKAKDEATKELETEIKKYQENTSKLPEDKKAEILKLLNDKKEAISKATKPEDATKLAQDAKKAAKDLADKYAQDLAEAKKTAKAQLDAKEKELDANKNQYTEEGLKELKKILADAKVEIDAKTDIKDIKPVVDDALSKFDKKAQEDKLAKAKKDAISELENKLKNSEKTLTPEEKEAFTKKLTEAKDKIQNATSIQDVNKIKDELNKLVDKAVADHELNAKKAQAKTDLDKKKDTYKEKSKRVKDDSRDDFLKQLDVIENKAKDKIDAAQTVEEIGQISNDAAEQMQKAYDSASKTNLLTWIAVLVFGTVVAGIGMTLLLFKKKNKADK